VPNDPSSPLVRFCLALEEFRRTQEGRVRSSHDFLAQFFPYDGETKSDRIFRHMPKAVRGPILAGWKIRGARTAVTDSDAKVEEVVHDALVAGDIGAGDFEASLTAEIVIRWVPLPDWWRFWRAGQLSERALLKAFTTAYEVELFDARWFLETLSAPPPIPVPSAVQERLYGTDVLAEGLSKADLAQWVANVHRAMDGSPRGLVAALGWEKIVRHTRAPFLVAVLDALAERVALAAPGDRRDANEGLRIEELVDDIEGLERTVVNGPEWAAPGPPTVRKAMEPPIPR